MNNVPMTSYYGPGMNYGLYGVQGDFARVGGMAGNTRPPQGMAPSHGNHAHVSTKPVVHVRLCDLRLLSGHKPTAASTDEPMAGMNFCVDGLYMVVRQGHHAQRTACLVFEDVTERGRIVDTCRGDAEPDMEVDEDELDELLALSGEQRVESTRACLVWDEHLVFHPSTPTHGDAAPPEDSLGASETEVGPILELELWRSTPSAERLLARYAYNIPMEALSFLTQRNQEWQNQVRADGGAGGLSRTGPSPALINYDPSIVVDKVLPLQGTGPHSAPHTALNSPALATLGGGSYSRHLHGGSAATSGGGPSAASAAAPPVKFGVRVRVQTSGVPLPTPQQVQAARRREQAASGASTPLTSSISAALLGSEGTAVMQAGGGYGLLSAPGFPYGGTGNSSSGGNGFVEMPVGSYGYPTAYHGPPGPMYAAGGGSNDGPRGFHAGLDPYFSQMLTPMALRSSMLATNTNAAAAAASLATSPHMGTAASSGPHTQGYTMMGGVSGGGGGGGGMPPPLVMPGSTATDGAYHAYPFPPQHAYHGGGGNIASGGLLDDSAEGHTSYAAYHPPAMRR